MRRTDAERVRVSGTGKWAACGAVALALSFLVAPAALSYDPEAWLLWGREAVEGRLDVTQGPAIKPLPIRRLIAASPLACMGMLLLGSVLLLLRDRSSRLIMARWRGAWDGLRGRLGPGRHAPVSNPPKR